MGSPENDLAINVINATYAVFDVNVDAVALYVAIGCVVSVNDSKQKEIMWIGLFRLSS